MKKALSILLSLLMVLSVIAPAIPTLPAIEANAATAGAGDAYATIFTASDFQDSKSGNLVEDNFKAMMNNAIANGSAEPDGFILGGDYESSYANQHSTPDAYNRVQTIITDVFPYFNTKNITAIQGNHDYNDSSVLDDTGLHEYEDYLVYVIANEDYPAGSSDNSKNIINATNAQLAATFDKLLARGETRPVFIATHLPLHHNPRPSGSDKVAYNENHYAGILFETINRYAKAFDVVVLFGHNHSGDYDDYIGGAVNYMAKGSTINVPRYDVAASADAYAAETLNFTYMNYGYMGYSGNKNDNTLTMNVFELCPDRIVITRYANVENKEVYAEYVINRNLKLNTPSVVVYGYSGGTLYSQTGALAIATGFEDPVYTWSSSAPNQAKIVTGNADNGSRCAEIAYLAAGTPQITVTVTEKNDATKTASASYYVGISGNSNLEGALSIRFAETTIHGTVVEYYNAPENMKISLIGSYEGLLADTVNAQWYSSNEDVATVDANGNVTFLENGTVFITYKVTGKLQKDNSDSIMSVNVRFDYSTLQKSQYVYKEIDVQNLQNGGKYVIGSNRSNHIFNGATVKNQGMALQGTAVAFSGAKPDRTVTVPDSSYVWSFLLRGSDDNPYFLVQNDSTGEYLSTKPATEDSAGSDYANRGDFYLTKEVPSAADGGWSLAANGNCWNGTYYWYVRSGGAINLTKAAQGYNAAFFEQIPLDPSVSIEFRGTKVNDTTQTIYSVTDTLKVPAYGSFVNVEILGSEEWSSSDPSVVTVDEDGMLSFKGKAGTSVIIYTVTDEKTGQEYSANFTIEAKLGAEATRTFRYTKTIQPGKKYIIVDKKTVGTGLLFSSFNVTNERLLADRFPVQTTADGEYFVNIPTHHTELVWEVESAGGSSYYIKNDATGAYLYANTTGARDDYSSLLGTVLTSASYAENTEQFTWTYTGSKLYNNFAYTDLYDNSAQTHTYIRAKSAEFLGIATVSQSEVFFYEEIEAEPNGVITLRYNVIGATYERNEICPGQSETFVPKAENFPDNNKVIFVWSTDNDAVATVDPATGVVTYTGKSGVVNLTLKSTSQIYDANNNIPEDVTTVKLIVNGGAAEEPETPDEPVNPDAPTYTENAFYKTTELIPGRRYVFRAVADDGVNVAISNENRNDAHVRLLCEAISAPMTDDYGEYVVTTDNAMIWECVESGVDGYVYLVNAENHKYLFASKSTSSANYNKNGVISSSSEHLEAGTLAYVEETILISYDSVHGMLRSKQIVERSGSPTYGIGNVDYSTSNGGYYYMNQLTYSTSSSRSFITLYAEPEKTPTVDPDLPTGEVFYLTDSFVVGKKYIIAHDNTVGGSAHVMSNQLTMNNNLSVGHVDELIESCSKGIYIANPSDDVEVFEAVESSQSGYVLLRAVQGPNAGKYLHVDYSNGRNIYTVEYANNDGDDDRPYSFTTGTSNEPCLKIFKSTDLNANVWLFWDRGGGQRYYASSVGSSPTYIYELDEDTASGGGSSGGGSSDIPDGDVYEYTETLVPGQKYLIATGKTGTVSVMTTETHAESGYTAPKSVFSDVITANDIAYIVKPEKAIVVECFPSDVEGYYYLKDAEGRYLTVGGNNGSSNKAVEFTDSLTRFAAEAYTLRIRTASAGYTVLESRVSDLKYLNLYTSSSNSANNRFFAGNGYQEMCLYIPVVREEVTTSVQVRKVDYFGSVNITNVTQYRYDIKNGDTEQLYRFLENVKDDYAYSWSSSDTSIAVIDATTGLVTYKGGEGHVTFTLTVTGYDAAGNPIAKTASSTFVVSKEPYKLSTDDYPIYPDEGSVRVNKTASNMVGDYTFQESGVTEIELSATGVPVSIPVDVVVVLDHSESMNDSNKLVNAVNDTRDFALQLFNENKNNRIAVVTFDQFRNHYVTIEATDMKDSSSGEEDRIVTGDGTIYNAFADADDAEELYENLESIKVNATGGTNYDSGLNYAYRILQYAQNDPNANKNQIVVFMTDGDPTKYNMLKLEDIGKEKTVSNAWLTGDTQTLAPYLENTSAYPAAAYFNADGDNWFAKAIKTPKGQAVEGLPAVSTYDACRKGLGAKLYTIGYGTGVLANKVLSTIASDPSCYYSANSGSLQAAYDKIISQILYAATDAVVTDTLGDYFNLQVAPNVLYIGGETLSFTPAIEIGSWVLDSDGNRVSYSTLEKITFTVNAQGYLTAATSTVAGSVYNQAANKIIGEYVTYDLATETFTWTIGDITRNEVTLKYLAYLDGAAQGTREGGIYDTNKNATLSYTNYRGTPAIKYFTTPSLGWKQAAINYEFYLVNAQGQPVNLSGIAVPFAERVIIGNEQTKAILLNSTDTVSGRLAADEVLPDGYVLYNANAEYTVTIASTGTGSSAAINDDSLTTYFRQGSKAVNVNGVIDGVTSYYNTSVSFAVRYSEGVIPDTIVIDYGLPVKISVLGNDYVVDGGAITGFAKSLASGTVLNDKAYTKSQLVNGAEDTLELTYGTVSIIEPDITDAWPMEKLVYTPTKINMPEEEVFYYEYNAGGNFYYAKVTVIPATSIYYEESFITFVDGTEETVGNEKHNVWLNAGEAVTGVFQAEDRPGGFSFDEYDKNNVYGYDSAYENSTTYSLGSAKKTTVNYNSFGKEATAKFTFSGTGFDFYSVTSADTGAVQVTIKNADTKTIVANYIVNTYYGYTTTDGNLTIKDNGALYQIPVISKRNLTYGAYDVVITPRYSSAFDPDFNGTNSSTNAYSIYVDSVRIFNPAGAGTDVSDAIGDAYFADGEISPEYKTVRSILLNVEDYTNLVSDKGYKGTLFLDGNAGAGVADYKAKGPNNEVYLAKGQAIAFELTTSEILTLASIQVGMKVVSGSSATAVVMNSKSQLAVPMTISGASENYYNISSVFEWKKVTAEDGSTYYKTANPVIIANASTDDAVLSLTSFKWTETAKPDSGTQTNFMVYPETAMYAARGLRTIMAAMDNELTEDKVTVAWADDKFVAGQTAILNVTTPAEVVSVMVDWEIDMECTIDENGNKLWTTEIELTEEGDTFYAIQIFTDEEAFEPALMLTEEIYVEAAPVEEETTEEETTEEFIPEEDETDNVESDEETEEEDTSITGRIKQMFDLIFNFFRNIIEFLRGVAK